MSYFDCSTIFKYFKKFYMLIDQLVFVIRLALIIWKINSMHCNSFEFGFFKLFYTLWCNSFIHVLRINTKFVKRSNSLDFIFNSSNIFNSLTLIYERIQFPNAFQIFNLNRDIAAMVTSKLRVPYNGSS